MDPFENTVWKKWLGQWFYLLLFFGILVNATGLFITILDSDGTLYATIAKNIAQSGDFINLKVEGKDWLDKPHFPFWLAALSYKIFGITTFAYKLPAFLCWLIGAFYTYQFGLKAYGKNVAQLSALLYVSAAHLVISNNDVRAEPYLTGFIIGSVYHFYIASRERKFSFHLLAGALLAAFAVMTKGPFVLIAIAAGFVIEWIINKQWWQFISYKWLLAIVLVGIFSLPEIYCLYQQFDMRPEKIVFGTTHVSGIKFFFWDSQFGRFFNNGPIKGSGDPLFYLHTILWAFLPWGLLFYIALVWKIFASKKASQPNEYIALGNGLVMLLIFSISKFQLPHYLNILFPFFCIITAQYIYQLTNVRLLAVAKWLQYAVIVALIALVVLLVYFYHPEQFVIAIIYAGLMVVASFVLFTKQGLPSIVGKSFMTAIAAYGFLNLFIYPSLMQYQSGSVAADYVNKTYPSFVSATTFAETSHSFTFYTQKTFVYGTIGQLKAIAQKQPLIVYTTKNGLDSLQKVGFKINSSKAFPFYHTSELTGEFINYKTRKETLEQHFVAIVTTD